MLVLDLTERAILVLDANGQSARQLGRAGDGPGEYRSPALVFAMGNDSSMVLDGQNRNWYLLDGVRFVELPDAMRAMRTMPQFELDGIDRYGKAMQLKGLGRYQRTEPFRFPYHPQHADTILLLRYHTRARVDTLATLRGQYFGMTNRDKVINGSAMGFGAILNPLQTHDQAAVFADGSVAVAYFAPYRVDFLGIDNHWTRGRPIPDNAPPVTNAVQIRSASGYQRDDKGRPVFEASDFPPWPPVVPPFVRDALYAGTDRRLYIRRTRLHPDDPQILDVFDKTVRIASIALQGGTRFVGAGARGVYVVSRDDNDEETLVRLRLVGPGVR